MIGNSRRQPAEETVCLRREKRDFPPGARPDRGGQMLAGSVCSGEHLHERWEGERAGQKQRNRKKSGKNLLP